VITFIFVVMMVVLLTVAGVFALAQMDKEQEGQSGSLSAASVGAEQETATRLD
jgi:hypothetical protein